MMDIKFGMRGFYRLRVKNCSGEVTRETGWFPNLITDNGLDLCATQSSSSWQDAGGMLHTVAVGAGATPPTVSDTSLESLVASTTVGSTGTTVGVDTTDRYFFCMREWSFAEGAAAGNISEIGVGVTNGNLFSRALVLDSGGSPTTITVLPDEFLTVQYELRINQPTGDLVETIDGYEVTMRSASVNDGTVLTLTRSWAIRRFRLAEFVDPGVSTQAIQPITSQPGSLTVTATINNDDYVNGTFTRTGEFQFSPAQANFSIASALFQFGPASFQMGFSPAINKTNTERLTIGVRLTWAREGELPS